MQEQLRLATGVPRTEDVLLSAQADTEAYYGRLEQARNFSRRAVDSAERADAMEAAATWEGWGALRETETGNLLEARRDAEQALALNRGRDIRVLAALALARAGDIVQAQQLAESADQEFPQDTLLQNYALPSIRAAIQLQQNKPLIAIETLEVSRPYELSQGSLTYMYPAYLRGEAYLKTGQGGKAAAEFKKILDHRGIVLNSPIAALAYLDLARSYVMHNDKAKAKAAYQDFLALWNNANPDIPIYKQAKAEYATLQ